MDIDPDLIAALQILDDEITDDEEENPGEDDQERENEEEHEDEREQGGDQERDDQGHDQRTEIENAKVADDGSGEWAPEGVVESRLMAAALVEVPRKRTRVAIVVLLSS